MRNEIYTSRVVCVMQLNFTLCMRIVLVGVGLISAGRCKVRLWLSSKHGLLATGGPPDGSAGLLLVFGGRVSTVQARRGEPVHCTMQRDDIRPLQSF